MPGDADGNHVVDEFDLWLWRQNHGQRVATTPLTARLAVPEPNGVILGLGFVLLLWPRRRHHGLGTMPANSCY